MASVPFLPLSQIINVSVLVTPNNTPGPAFNQPLFVGPTNVIPSAERLRLYGSLNDVAADFNSTQPEYKAAALYFQQFPLPMFLWIGRQDLTAIITATVGAGGTGYTLGQILTVVQLGGSLGTLRVTQVSLAGAVEATEIVSGGTGYSDAAGLAVAETGGATFTITVGETPLDAIRKCRLENGMWYGCAYVGTPTDQDHLDIAEYIETAYPPSTYFLTTGEESILVEGASPASNVLALLQAAAYKRTFSIYSTVQCGTFPTNIYAECAVLGVICGRITGLAGSYFDVMFKAVAGVGPEPLTVSQVTHIAGAVDRSQIGLNGNVIVEYQNGDIWCQSAVMASGNWFDEILNLDMLTYDMQQAGVAALVDQPAVPITDAGVLGMKNVISGACQRSQAIGFIAPSGVWDGPSIGTGAGSLRRGDPLPKGYFVYAPPVSTWPRAQKAKRILPPITVALIEAQSGHSLSVSVLVQQ